MALLPYIAMIFMKGTICSHSKKPEIVTTAEDEC